jgi:hypothetical protein
MLPTERVRAGIFGTGITLLAVPTWAEQWPYRTRLQLCAVLGSSGVRLSECICILLCYFSCIAVPWQPLLPSNFRTVFWYTTVTAFVRVLSHYTLISTFCCIYSSLEVILGAFLRHCRACAVEIVGFFMYASCISKWTSWRMNSTSGCSHVRQHSEEVRKSV